MSPLQSYAFEIVPASDEIAVIGAAVNAIRAASQISRLFPDGTRGQSQFSLH